MLGDSASPRFIIAPTNQAAAIRIATTRKIMIPLINVDKEGLCSSRNVIANLRRNAAATFHQLLTGKSQKKQ
jgi:hypothetical protein